MICHVFVIICHDFSQNFITFSVYIFSCSFQLPFSHHAVIRFQDNKIFTLAQHMFIIYMVPIVELACG